MILTDPCIHGQCSRLRATIVRESIPQQSGDPYVERDCTKIPQHTVFRFLEYDFGRALSTSTYISDVILQELERSIYMLSDLERNASDPPPMNF